MVGLLARNAPAVRDPARFPGVPLVVQLLLPAEATLLSVEEQRTLHGRHFDDESTTLSNAMLSPRAAGKAADVMSVERRNN